MSGAISSQGVLTNDEQKQLQMLKTRRDLHNEIYTSRLQREEKAKQRAGLVRRYIGEPPWVIMSVCL